MIHAGRLLDVFYVLDVESGSLFGVDETAYHAAKLMEAGVTERSELLASLGNAADAESAVDELLELKEQGRLFSPCMADKRAPVFNEPVIKSLCLHAAHDCNLRCAYCFADDGKYKGDRGLMPVETAKAALDFLIEKSAGRKHLEVDFFGGEPLLNPEMVRETVAYGRELERRTGKEIRFTMTTNGYAVSDEMADFINAEMKNLVISIDGRREVHDAVRKTASGTGSYDRAAENAKKLIEGRGDGEYYIRGTYTAHNLDFADDVRAIAELGFDQISIEPVVGELDFGLTDEHLPAIEAEYERLAKYIWDEHRAGKHLNFFHFMIDFSSGPCLNKRLRGCGAGLEYAAVTPKGDIYPCHQFADKPEFRMGSVLTGEFRPEVAGSFHDCHIYNKPECDGCWAKYFCSGGCAADAYASSGDIMKPRRISCDIERARLNAAIALYIKKRT